MPPIASVPPLERKVPLAEGINGSEGRFWDVSVSHQLPDVTPEKLLSACNNPLHRESFVVFRRVSSDKLQERFITDRHEGVHEHVEQIVCDGNRFVGGRLDHRGFRVEVPWTESEDCD